MGKGGRENEGTWRKGAAMMRVQHGGSGGRENEGRWEQRVRGIKRVRTAGEGRENAGLYRGYRGTGLTEVCIHTRGGEQQ